MKAFFDSSALAKRYIDESGSERIESICLKAEMIGVSIICMPEIISALCRLKRESVITQNQYNNAKQALFNDLKDAMVCNITPSVIRQSIKILEENSIRAMDALHLGCALEWKASVFVSSDLKQISSAQNAGLKIIKI
ncbi:MAG: type II toxin-antitoxin system VapC family toxin [bacterium]